MRKRCNRRAVVPLPPRGLRPKLDRRQLRDLALAHLVNLDAIARGEADESLLWQVVGGVLTWSRAAELMQHRVDDMRQQLELVTSLVQRYGRTGCVGFSGPEYQLAKAGVDLMDELAERIDQPTAVAAAEWGEARVQAWAAPNDRIQPRR